VTEAGAKGRTAPRARRKPPPKPARGAKPHGTLRIVETRVYRGPNYWSYEPAIKLIVDLGELESFPTNLIPGFTDALLGWLPGVAQHSCSTGRAGGFVKRLRDGTWVGHVAEHIALQLQRDAHPGVDAERARLHGQHRRRADPRADPVARRPDVVAVDHVFQPDAAFGRIGQIEVQPAGRQSQRGKNLQQVGRT